MNYLTLNLIDVEHCQTIIRLAKMRNHDHATLLHDYSNKIQSKYMDKEALQYELDDLQSQLKCTLTVNTYDDLIASW